MSFFNKCKTLFEDYGVSWHEAHEEGFLWGSIDKGTGIVWFFYLYADALRIILGFNGIQRANVLVKEESFYAMYQRCGGVKTSIYDLTKDDLSKMLSRFTDDVRVCLNRSKNPAGYADVSEYFLNFAAK